MEVKAWVVSAEMGYGHHRAAYALEDIAEQGVINAGDASFVSEKEKSLWTKSLAVYEHVSRLKSIPLIGKPLFGIMDKFLHIPSFYPIRDLSEQTFQVRMLVSSINKGLCNGVLQKIQEKYLPMVTSFYAPAVAADLAGYDQIYCIICDADINRVWVAPEPWDSRIRYFAPCGKAAQRLKAYGVSEDKIFITGFPLHDSLLGGRNLAVLKNDLGQRLSYLDPKGKFKALHGKNAEYFLGKDNLEFRNERVLTITFAVGGAGAQKETAQKIIKGIKKKLENNEIRIILVAGIRKEVYEYFAEIAKTEGIPQESYKIIYSENMEGYFNLFNRAIRETDILWTKPSELSFYSGLGIPVIMTQAIGSQEKFNRKWLREIGAGIKQEKPEYADQWLIDLLNDGRLAEAAWSGFLKARKLGIYKIYEVLETGSMITETSPVLR